MKEIKEELIHKTYVTKYEANDGTIFTTSEECQKYENSARAALLAKYKELEIKMISEYNLFGVGSEEYYVSVVKLRNESDVDLMTQLYFLFNPRYESDSCHIEEARSIFRKAVKMRLSVPFFNVYNFHFKPSFLRLRCRFVCRC